MLYTHAAGIFGKGLPNFQPVVNYRAGRAIERTEGVNRGHRQEKEVLLRFTSCRPASRQRNTRAQPVSIHELLINVHYWPVSVHSFKLKIRQSVAKFADSCLQYQKQGGVSLPPTPENFMTPRSSSDKSVRKRQRSHLSQQPFFGLFFFPLTHPYPRSVVKPTLTTLLGGGKGLIPDVQRRTHPGSSCPLRRTQQLISSMTEHLQWPTICHSARPGPLSPPSQYCLLGVSLTHH